MPPACCNTCCGWCPCTTYARFGCISGDTGRRIVCGIGIFLVVLGQIFGIVACVSISKGGDAVKNVPFAYASNTDWDMVPGGFERGTVEIFFGLQVAVFRVASGVDLSMVPAGYLPEGIEAGKDLVLSWSDIKDSPLICTDGDGDTKACHECADKSGSLIALVILVTIFNIFSLFPFIQRMNAEKDSVFTKNMSLLLLIGVVLNLAQLGHFDQSCFQNWIKASGGDDWTTTLAVGWWFMIFMVFFDAAKLILHALIPVPDGRIKESATNEGTAMGAGASPGKQPAFMVHQTSGAV
jgi:hypothetical protein